MRHSTFGAFQPCLMNILLAFVFMNVVGICIWIQRRINFNCFWPLKVSAKVPKNRYEMNGETMDHLFLHSSMALSLWHKLLRIAEMNWVSLESLVSKMCWAFAKLLSVNELWLCLALIVCGMVTREILMFLRIDRVWRAFGTIYIFGIFLGLFFLILLPGSHSFSFC